MKLCIYIYTHYTVCPLASGQFDEILIRKHVWTIPVHQTKIECETKAFLGYPKRRTYSWFLSAALVNMNYWKKKHARGDGGRKHTVQVGPRENHNLRAAGDMNRYMFPNLGPDCVSSKTSCVLARIGKQYAQDSRL